MSSCRNNQIDHRRGYSSIPNTFHTHTIEAIGECSIVYYRSYKYIFALKRERERESMDNTTTTNDDEMMMMTEVVTSWTPIWVTLLVCTVQGVIFYGFFGYRRRHDGKLYHMETEKLLNTTTDGNHSQQQQQPAAALTHCQLYESRQYTRSHRSPTPFGATTSWWRQSMNISNEELLKCVGLDTYMFLRLFHVGTRVTGWGTFLSLVLLPIYATGSATGIATEQFNLLTIARVESGGSSWRLYVTVAVWYAFIGVVLREFWNEWQMFYVNRTTFDATGDMDMPIEYRYTVRIEKVPSDTNTDKQLRTYLEQMFPQQVYETAAVIQTKSLEQLMEKRQKIILKLEACVAAAASNTAKSNQPKQIKVKKLGKVDAIPYYESEIERYNQEIDVLRTTLRGGLNTVAPPKEAEEKASSPPPPTILNEEGVETGLDMKHSTTSAAPTNTTLAPSDPMMTSTTSTAFVTFTTLRAKQAAIQCELTGDPDTIRVFPAADPTVGTIWSNVTVPLSQQSMLQFYAAVFFTVGILFWALPVSFVTSISNLNSILAAFGLKQANPSVFWYGLVAGLLPVIMLVVLMIVLYMVITAAATSFIRYKSWPEVDAYCLYWHMMFQFANLWLILIGGSLFGQIDTIIETPEFRPILETIAKAMPSSSVFFVNMILCSSFNAFGMELSMLVKYIVTMIMNKISPEASQTQRQLDDKKKPPSLVWGQKVPPVIFIFMVSILYSK